MRQMGISDDEVFEARNRGYLSNQQEDGIGAISRTSPEQQSSVETHSHSIMFLR